MDGVPRRSMGDGECYLSAKCNRAATALGHFSTCLRNIRPALFLLVLATIPVKTFRELYCEHHGIAYDKFERVLLWRCLHWQARPFYWLLWGVNRDYYSADFDFIRGVGDLRTRRDFRNEAAEFHYHPGNRGFLRTILRMRVSSHRLQTIFEREISSTNTTPPMPA